MKALILKSEKRILQVVGDASELKGAEKAKFDHSDGQGGTIAVLVDVPAGFTRDELIVNDDFTVSGDTVKQAERLAREQAISDRKAKINAGKSAQSVPELREAFIALAEHVGFVFEAQ